MRRSVVKNPAARGGRWLEIAPARLPGWVESFTQRHGGVPEVRIDPGSVTFTAPDGAVAECHPPFLPVALDAAPPGGAPFGAVGPGWVAPGAVAGALAKHSLADRTVGVLLVRLGGYAAGVFTGSPPRLVRSKTGSRLVHGRSAAGGWSQHRFARRREKQAAEALKAAAGAAVTVLGPVKELDAVVLGGDKRTIAALRDDPRLAPYLDLATDRFLTVPDPKLAVLKDTPRLFTAIRIRLTEPA